jgi:hypothetical protein
VEIIAQLGSIMGLSFISGINLYATVAVVGLCGRLQLVQALPPGLEPLTHGAVIFIALLLYVVEFLADKVPGFDSFWDSIHTFIRPFGGAMLALMQVGEASPALEVIVFLLGASLASATHFTKAGGRLIVNTSPEPVSNTLVSLGEDAGAVGFSYLSIAYPKTTFFVTLCLLLVIGYLTPLILRTMRMVFSGLFFRLKCLFGGRPAAEGNPSHLPLAYDEYLDTQKGAEEKVVWTGKAFARKISGIKKFVLLRVVITDKVVYFLYRRWFRFRALQIPIKEIQKARLFPRLLVSKWQLRSEEKNWLVGMYRPLSETLPENVARKG